MMGYDGLRISDGMHREDIGDAETIWYKNKNGDRVTLHVEQYYHSARIKEVKVTNHNRIKSWTRYGEFYREYGDNKTVELHFHPQTKQGLHGICKRNDAKFLDQAGTTISKYARGSLVWQKFFYSNRKLAYHYFHRRSLPLVIKNPNGKVKCTIEGSLKRYTGSHGLPINEEIFNPNKHSDKNFTIKGDALLLSWVNGQAEGHWILPDERERWYMHGVEVSKRIYETPADKLPIKDIINHPNAQIRMAILSKIKPEDLIKQTDAKLIHHDKVRKNRLFELPITVDDGNGNKNSRLRYLQVTCTSTASKYYLQVPDFVWDDGRKTKLDTCEQARQWTFHMDKPNEAIKFAKET